MKINIAFQDNKSYLTAVCNGEWDSTSGTQVVTQIKEKAEQSSHTRILIDWRGVSLPKSEFIRYQSGLDVAKYLTHPLKIATVGLPENINHFAETAAVNRGANFKVFENVPDALNWLLPTPQNRLETEVD